MTRKTSELEVKLVLDSPVDVHRRLLPEVTVSDPHHPAWLFFLQVDFDGAVVTFRVVPDLAASVQTPPPRLTARTLKEFELHLYARGAHEFTTRLMRKWAPNPKSEPEAANEFAILDSMLDLKKPGRRGRPEIEYARVAARYVDRLGSATPLKDLAREMCLSEVQVRSFLTLARSKGLLTHTPKGVAGGTLTDRAEQLLRSSQPATNESRKHKSRPGTH